MTTFIYMHGHCNVPVVLFVTCAVEIFIMMITTVVCNEMYGLQKHRMTTPALLGVRNMVSGYG